MSLMSNSMKTCPVGAELIYADGRTWRRKHPLLACMQTRLKTLRSVTVMTRAMCGSVRSHRATHRLLCSNSSPRKAFLSSPNHRTLRISLRVTFGCSLLWKWASRGRVSQPWKTSNATAELQKIPKEEFRRCFQQRQDWWSKCVCARKGSTLKVIR